jgi:hypothetical protein
MTRAFFILVIVIFLGQATGTYAFAAGEDCIQSCPEDERLDGQCAPLCLCYTCDAHHRPLTPVVRMALPGQHFLQWVLPQPTRAPARLAHFAIFHVPKRVLA